VTHDEVSELLGAYALDAVEPDEAVLVAAHVATCPRCTAELDEYREVAGFLGNLGGDAPSELWDAIASQATRPHGSSAAILAALPAGVPGATSRRTSRRPVAWRTGMGVLATAAAILIVLLTVKVSSLDTTVGRLEGLTQSRGISEAAQAALLDPSTTRVPLDASSGSMVAELVVVPHGRSFLVGSTLASLPKSETYQLWAISATKKISLGLLGAAPADTPFVASSVGGAMRFAITVEPASGSTAPTSTPIAISA
jgi:anti-sigma factor RsiW